MEKTKILNFLNRFFPPIALAWVIFSFSSQSTLPGVEVIWWDFFTKKAAHMTIYALLFFSIQRAINWNTKKKVYKWAIILTLLYAISDEYHQSFIPGRTSLPTDVGYDMIGVSLTWLRLKELI